MSGIRRVSQLGTTGESTYVDGSIQGVDIAGSIALTGTPTAPTATFFTNSTQLATTAFVNTAIDNVSDGYRNIFINGGFAVDQRGMATSHTVTAGAALSYTVDRWYEYCTGANVTAARVAYNPILGSPQNPYYYYTFTGATSNTLVGFGQRIETANVLGVSGEYCTLSARMVVGSGTKTVTWTAYYANTTDTFGTLASPTRTSIATGTFSVTTTQTDFSAYFQIPVPVTGVEIVFTCPTLTSGQTISFGNIQLEKGLRLVPTPFQQRPIGTELALCQRYYEDSVTTTSTVGANVGLGGNTYCAPTFFKVTKRIGPTTVNGANDTSGNIRMWNNVGAAGSVSYYQGGWSTTTSMTMDWSGTWGFSLTTTGGLTDADLVAFRYAYSAEL